MATVTTTTLDGSIVYPPTRLFERNTTNGNPLNGHLYLAVRTASTTIQVYRSTDNGTSWAAYGSLITRTGLQELCGIMVPADPHDYMHICYRVSESNLDKVYTARLKLAGSPTWSTEKLVGSVANGGVAGAVWTGVAMYAYYEFNLWTHMAFAIGTVRGANRGVQMIGCYWDPQGNFFVGGPFAGTVEWFPEVGSGRVGPAIDVEHIGDGHDSGYQPHMWVSWGRTGLYLAKLPYDGNRNWRGPASPITIDTGFTAQDAVTGRWDGSRFIMAMPNKTAGDLDTVAVYERDKANSATIMRVTPAHPAGTVKNCTVSSNVVAAFQGGNLRVYAVGTSNNDLYYVDYNRIAGTWSSWATVSTTDVLGAAQNNWGVRGTNWGSTRFDSYRSATGTGVITHDAQIVSYTPNAPQWVNITGQSKDVAASLLLDWVFSDSDPNDTQKDYAVSRQIGAGSLAYWRASDSTWQAAEVKNNSGTTSLTLAASWGTGADAPHTYRVKTWDQSDNASAYSDPLVVIASAVVNPSITSPTPAQVLTGDSVTITWTVSEQSAFRVILDETSPSAVTRHDSGWVTAPVTTLSYVVPFSLATGAAYTLRLQTANNEGLISVQQTRSFTVSFLAPDAPTLVATPTPASGYIRVVITNPTPTGGRPTVTSNDLYRRVASAGGDGVRIAASLGNGATHDDWRAVSGVSYEYAVLARGSNGTSVLGAWTA